MFLLVHHANTQHIFQDLVHHFYLPVYFRVICGIKVKLGFHGLLETSPKSSCKHQSSIRYDPFRLAMKSHNLTDKNSSYVWRLIHCTHWDKMCTLRQSVNYHKNQVVPPCHHDNQTIKSIKMAFHFDSRMTCR
jgi:hypothetical protein